MTSGGGGAMASMFVNVVPTVAGITSAFASAGKAGAQATAGAFKEAWSSASADLGLENFGAAEFAKAGKEGADAFAGAFGKVGDFLKPYIKTALELSDEFTEAGAGAAEAFMTGMENVMGKADPQALLGGFSQEFVNFEKVGTDAIEATAGKIPIIGGAIDTMVDTAEGGFNTLFGLTEKWIGMLLDVGTTWQETERTLAAHTPDMAGIEHYMGMIQEVAASGAVVHFKDIADNIALVNQRLPELTSGLGGSDERLKQFVVTLAQGKELLGDVEVNTNQVTAAMEAFQVSGEDMNGELLNMIHTSQRTGIDFNNMTASLDRLGQGFHDLGFGIGDLTWLLGETNKEGVKTTSFVYALGTMLNQLSKQVESGQFPDITTAFKVDIDAIRDNLNSADKEVQAVGIQRLKTLTGQRVTPALLDAVKGGMLEMQEYMDQKTGELRIRFVRAGEDQDPIGQMVEETATLQQRLEVIGNQLKAAFMPVSLALSKGLESQAGGFSQYMAQHADVVIQEITNISHTAMSFMTEVFQVAGQGMIALAPIMQFMMHAMAEFGFLTWKALTPIEQAVVMFEKLRGHTKEAKDIAASWGEVGYGLQQFTKIDIQDPFIQLGKGSEIFAKQLPQINDQMTQVGDKAANLSKIQEAFQQTREIKPGPSAPEGTPSTFEPMEAFDITEGGQLKLIGDIQKTKDQLHAKGVDLVLGPDGLVQSIQATSPQMQDAMQAFLDEAFATKKTKEGKPYEVPYVLKPTLETPPPPPLIPPAPLPEPGGPGGGPSLGLPGQPASPATPAQTPPPSFPAHDPSEDGPPVTDPKMIPQWLQEHPDWLQSHQKWAARNRQLLPSHMNVPAPPPVPQPGPPPPFPAPIDTGGAVPATTSGFTVPINPTLPEGPGGAGGISPDKVKSWMATHFNLPKWKMNDDGTTTIPTSPDIDTGAHKAITVGEVMTAAGIPSEMQGSEGVEIPTTFKMSGHGDLGSRVSAHFPKPGGGAEAWRPAVHAIMLQSGGLAGVRGGFKQDESFQPAQPGPIGQFLTIAPWIAQRYLREGIGAPSVGAWTAPIGHRYGGQAGIPRGAMQSWEDAIVRQIQTESGGDPNAINKSDENWIAGHPSQGLLQFIPSTYAAHNISGRPFPDPYGEIAAILDYVPQAWGVGPDGSPNRIGRGVGYAEGGPVPRRFSNGGESTEEEEEQLAGLHFRGTPKGFVPMEPQGQYSGIGAAPGGPREAEKGATPKGKAPRPLYKAPPEGVDPNRPFQGPRPTSTARQLTPEQMKAINEIIPGSFPSLTAAMPAPPSVPTDPGTLQPGPEWLTGVTPGSPEWNSMTLQQQNLATWFSMTLGIGGYQTGGHVGTLPLDGQPFWPVDPGGLSPFNPMEQFRKDYGNPRPPNYGWPVASTNQTGGLIGFQNGGDVPYVPGLTGPAPLPTSTALLPPGKPAPPGGSAVSGERAGPKSGLTATSTAAGTGEAVSIAKTTAEGADVALKVLPEIAEAVPWLGKTLPFLGTFSKAVGPVAIPYDVFAAANWVANLAGVGGRHNLSPTERLQQIAFYAGRDVDWNQFRDFDPDRMGIPSSGGTGRLSDEPTWRPGYQGVTTQGFHIPFTNTTVAAVAKKAWSWLTSGDVSEGDRSGGVAGRRMCAGGHMYAAGGEADNCPWCDLEKRTMKKADGGEIPWLERSVIGEDSIFAMLEPGEFIVRRDVAQANLPQLHALNSGVGGALKFAGGGATSAESPYTGDTGVLQVIYSDIGSGEKVGEAAGEYVGPGTSQPGYYGGDWAGHTGHVHTSFATGPDGQFYGMPKGTEAHDQAMSQFPDWAKELGDEYGVYGTTYAGHQESSGYNRGIDWWPAGRTQDMSGQSYSDEDRVTLTTFAEAMAGAGAGGGGGAGAPAAWGDMLDGGSFGDGDGDDYGDDYGDGSYDTSDDDFGMRRGGTAGRFGGGGKAYGYSIGYGGDVDSGPGPPSPLPPDTVHGGTTTTPVPVTPVDSSGNPFPQPTLGTANQPGFIPATGPPAGLGVGPHAGGPGEPQYSPYGPLPPQSAMSQEQYDKWKASWDKRTFDDMNQNDEATDLQGKINDLQTKIAKEKGDQLQADQDAASIMKAGGPKFKGEQDTIDKATTLDNQIKSDTIELHRLQREQTGKRIKDEDKEPYPEAPGMKKGARGEAKPSSEAEKLGKGFIQGLFQEMGFTEDVFGKPFTEWGIWKMAMTGAGFGMNLLKNLNPKAPAFTGDMSGFPLGKGMFGAGKGATQGALDAVHGPQLPKDLKSVTVNNQPTFNQQPRGNVAGSIPYEPAEFDDGGWLMPGQPGMNMTGKPELVLTPAQSQHVTSPGGATISPAGFPGLTGVPSFQDTPRYGRLGGQTGPGYNPSPGGAPGSPLTVVGDQSIASGLIGMLGGMIPRASSFLPHVTNNHFDNRGNISTESERAVTKIAAPQPQPGTFASGPVATMR